MKKFLLSLATVLCTTVSAFAADGDITIPCIGATDWNNKSAYNSTNESKTSFAGTKWTQENLNNNNNAATWTGVRGGSNNASYPTSAYIYSSTAVASPIASISVKAMQTTNYASTSQPVSISLMTADNAEFNNATTTAKQEIASKTATDYVFTVSKPAANLYYKVVFSWAGKQNKNGVFEVQSITLTPAPQELGEIMAGDVAANNQTLVVYSGEELTFSCENATHISYGAEDAIGNTYKDQADAASIAWTAPNVTSETLFQFSVTAKDKDNNTQKAVTIVTVKPARVTTSLTFASESLDFGADKIGTEIDGLIPTVTPEDAVVKYSSDNSEIVSVDENTGKLTINKIGTAVITATVAGTETYSDATASYSVNVSYSRLAQLLSLNKDDKFTLKNGNMTVVYKNGDYLYIQDETAGMLVFKNSNTYTIGSKFTELSGTYSPYNGLPEITSGILDGFTTDDPITVKPVVRSVDYVSADVLNQYIMVEDLTIELSGSDYIATDVNGNTITLFKRWSNVTIPTGGHLSVAGFTSYYIDPKTGNTTLQIFPTEITGYVSPVSIIEGENTLTGDIVLSGADRTVNFTYPGHIEVWYKWEPTATPESVRARVASVDDNGFTKHEGEDIVLSTSGTLSYYSVNNGVKSAVSTIGVSGSGTTSISEISAELNGAEVIYDLQGRRVNRAVKGIFIVNGKKELRK